MKRTIRNPEKFIGKRVNPQAWELPEGYNVCAMTWKFYPESELCVTFQHLACDRQMLLDNGIYVEDAEWLSEEGYDLIIATLDRLGFLEEYQEACWHMGDILAGARAQVGAPSLQNYCPQCGRWLGDGSENRLCANCKVETEEVPLDMPYTVEFYSCPVCWDAQDRTDCPFCGGVGVVPYGNLTEEDTPQAWAETLKQAAVVTQRIETVPEEDWSQRRGGCDFCGSTGLIEDDRECPQCYGEGVNRVDTWINCQRCGGRGFLPGDLECPDCHGEGGGGL